jgi:putative peptide zinc metalloprotease protein
MLRHLVSVHCLGLDMPDDPFLPQQNQIVFALYTVAATFYRWLVFFSIMMLLNEIFKPYGLQIVGQVIALAGIVGLVVMPIVQLVQFLNIPGRIDQVKSTNVMATLGVVAAVLAFIGFFPLPSWVKCPVELRPHNATSVFVTTPGRVEKVFVKIGEQVKEGQIIAQLANLDIEGLVADQEARLAQQQKQLENLERIRFDEPAAALQIDSLKESIKATTDQLATTRHDLAELTIKATAAGTILPSAWRSKKGLAEEQLPTWLGEPLLPQNIGAFLQASDVLCQIGPPGEIDAVAVIDQADVEMIHERGKDFKAEVHVKIDGFASEVFEGQVEEIAKIDLKESPKSLSHEVGYEVATKADSAGRLKPLNTSYQARILLDNPEGLKVGMRGRVKIYTGWKPLWSHIWRYASQTFNFRL